MAAVYRVAGVELMLAQGLPAGGAVLAGTAGVAEPRDRQPGPFLNLRDAPAHALDYADALLAGDERQLGLDRSVAVGSVNVRVTEARRLDL